MTSKSSGLVTVIVVELKSSGIVSLVAELESFGLVTIIVAEL